MNDDKRAERHPSGFEVLTPRGVQEGGLDHGCTAAGLLPPSTTNQLPDADQHVRAHSQAMASLVVFDQAYWSLDRVLSWIMYRGRFHMDTPHLHGTMYPTMPGVPTVIEPAPASRLLQALRRAESPIPCFRDGREVHGSEWVSVNVPSAPKRWPPVVFAREDVLQKWPPVLQREGELKASRSQVRSESTPGTKPVKFERTKMAMLDDLKGETLAAGEKHEALATRYGVGRGVAVKAYREALSEFGTPTNADTK